VCFVTTLEEIRRSEVSRRAFLARMGAAGLGSAALALLAGCGSDSGTIPITGGPTPSPSPSTGPTFLDPVNFPGIVGRSIDEVVLNYALTLEILESDLYRQALNLASGRDINRALDSSVPAPNSTGGYTRTVATGSFPSAAFADAAFLYLVQYAYVEAAHRDFLRTALSGLGAPVAAANPNGYTTTLSSGATLRDIIDLLFAVEETGVRAYLGAAGFMSDAALKNGLITTAVAIHSTEARHSEAIAYVTGRAAGPQFAIPGVVTGKRVTDADAAPYTGFPGESEITFQYYSDPAAVLSAVRPFIR
jgi:hypothetical protein